MRYEPADIHALRSGPILCLVLLAAPAAGCRDPGGDPARGLDAVADLAVADVTGERFDEAPTPGVDAGDDGDVGADVAAPPDGPPEADGPACGAGLHRVAGACVRDGGVRPIQPTSLGDTTRRRPTLRWALPEGADGAVVELCRDRGCTEVIETLRVAGTSARPSADLPPRSVVFWRARARVGAVEDRAGTLGPTWLFHTPARDAVGGVDVSFNAHADVNGDGVDDLVALEAGSGLDSAHRGVVRTYHGSARGLGAAPSREIEWRDGGGLVRAAPVGDVNGDGFGDVVLSSPADDRNSAAFPGHAILYLGSAAGLSGSAARVFEGRSGGDYFGVSVAGAGDVNADGFADFLVGATRSGGRLGSVSVFHGAAGGAAETPARVLVGEAPGAGFGARVAGVGDANADGFADIAVGTLDGVVRTFHGSAAGVAAAPAGVLRGSETALRFGDTVAGAGDVNADGFADLAVGAVQPNPFTASQAGTVSVFLGGAAGISGSASVVVRGGDAGDFFGLSLAVTGDVNGDGFDDVVVGAPLASPAGRRGAGAVSVFLGSERGVAASPAHVLEGELMEELFGGTVVCRDVNGDGFDDVVVGARQASPGGRAAVGAVRVHFGAAAGPAARAAQVIEGGTVNSYFGDVACAGRPQTSRAPSDLPRRG